MDERCRGGNTGNVAFVHGSHNVIGNNFVPVGLGDILELVNEHLDHVVCCAKQLG